MTRRRTAQGMHGVEQAADDLLAGRVPPDARELLETIHAINPTGRSLSGADERRRYAVKARLQSLLVRAFSDDLVVTAGDHGVVAIRHRYLGLDACHARLDELDDDARARVQWRLDVGEAGDPELGGAGTPGEPEGDGDGNDDGDGRLARARAALAEYDYDAARAHFEHAALGAGGSPVAARELLELLVDQLALDAEALGIEGGLPPRVAAAADVRALLAVAAARMGNAEAATRLLDGLVGPRVADAWAALAEGALRRQAFDDLDRHLARLIAADPAHPEIVRLRGDAGRLRADARRPAEQDLARLAEAAEDAEIEGAARALLARWPDSAVAGKILGRLHERQRTLEAERLIERARQALSEGTLARASELSRQARAHGADTTALAAQIQDADAAQRRTRDDADVAAVCAQLGDADPRPGLAAYLALDPELRRRVRSQAGVLVLDWVEQIAARAKGARPAAVADAALALPSAAAALDRGDDEAALAALDAHPLVIAVLRASELRAEAQRRIATRQHDAASEALDHARRALAAGDLERCEHACDRIDRRNLDAAQRPQLDEVRRAARERRALARRRSQVDELARSGDLVSAARELAALLAAGPLAGDDLAALRARHGELRAELARAWRVRRDDLTHAGGEDRLGELVGPLPYTENCLQLLTDGGAELVVASAAGPHVFLGRASVADGRLLERRYLRTPEPMGRLVMTTVDDDSLWLADDAGHVLQVSWATGEPVRWCSLSQLLAHDDHLSRVFVLPGGSHLWTEADTAGRGALAARVIEIEPWRVRRELPPARHLHPVMAGSASCVIGMGYDGGAVRYSERGTVTEELAACAGIRVTAGVFDPDRELVVFGGRPYVDHDGEVSPLEILRLRAGRVIHRQALPSSDHEMRHHCSVARTLGLLFVCYAPDSDGELLLTFPLTGSGLGPARSVRAPSDLVFVQDAEANQVVVLWDGTHRMEIARLSAEPPAFNEAVLGQTHRFVPTLSRFFSCGTSATAQIPGVEAGESSPQLAAANTAADQGDWPEVRRLLEDIPLERVAEVGFAHHCHLLGLAWLRTGGDPARVRELWQLGQSRKHPDDRIFDCQLAGCLELVEPMPDPLPPSWWSPDTPVVRQLRGAIATADRHLAADDPRAALEVLRERVVTRSRELQSAARLAFAWLEVPPDHAGEVFDKAIALSRFVALAAAPDLNLPIEGAWSAAQLTAIAARAEPWLASWHERV